jgi:hypothetical protein
MHAAFGWVIVRNCYGIGDVTLADTRAAVRSHIFYTKGSFVWTDHESGEHVLDCVAGRFIHSDEGPRRVVKGEATAEESVFFCIDPKINKGRIPEVKPVSISGETTLLAGSKLFLCEGAVNIKGKVIEAPAQIKLTFDTPVVNTSDTAYGLLF